MEFNWPWGQNSETEITKNLRFEDIKVMAIIILVWVKCLLIYHFKRKIRRLRSLLIKGSSQWVLHDA
ncbi:P6 protein [Rice stripe mosaic virus]|uniref:P6 protein n=1 Tax=Rice stripe mosaic virus TaxID=1931356 RepID=A0A1P8D6S5_9RHAB|nr:P6 protein [Rice stripe mosaic virus]APR74653.1 P6 protein [Rice stripe mosaic virus]AZB50416.1 P6 protein [Rice stripe mosaic virus]AZB50423.1 P6 protein [Rice stripe mosaic virus]AZB50430.1 P6 protein [Rice stripe mosaic virus]AZB50437.1 P6 protein [Rice stripe mosaic virus]